MTGVPGGKTGTIRSSTASTAVSSLKHRCTRSAPRTASVTSAKAEAPTASRARAFSNVRFQTRTFVPRRRRPRTKAEPRSPAPQNATVSVRSIAISSGGFLLRLRSGSPREQTQQRQDQRDAERAPQRFRRAPQMEAERRIEREAIDAGERDQQRPREVEDR